MDAWYDDGRVRVFHGDCLDVLRQLPDCSVDAVVTDPPAGISFMGKSWDGDKGGRDQWIAWLAERMAEALRVVKPGGHALVWALPRTSHWTALALEDAGWEIRDCVQHLFGSGFPKSLDVSRAIDKAAGAEREVIGINEDYLRRKPNGMKTAGASTYGYSKNDLPTDARITAPATDAARQWEGFGTSLKPASETWWLCRKPLTGAVATTVLEWGTGALNIDGCRVATSETLHGSTVPNDMRGGNYGTGHQPAVDVSHYVPSQGGRWPSNVVLSHVPLVDGDGVVVGDACAEGCQPGCPVLELDEQSGVLVSSLRAKQYDTDATNAVYGDLGRSRANPGNTHGDSGGASRFFATFRYTAKADSAERPRVKAEGGDLGVGHVAHPT